MIERQRRLIDEHDLRPRLDVVEALMCFRVTSPGQDALLLRSTCPWGGRYHHPGEAQCLYCSLNPSAAVMEWERRAKISLIGAEVRLTKLKVSGRVMNLIDTDGQCGMHVSEEDLIDDDITLCREAAHVAMAWEADGMLVPSVASSGSTNLVVFHKAVERAVELVDSLLKRLR